MVRTIALVVSSESQRMTLVGERAGGAADHQRAEHVLLEQGDLALRLVEHRLERLGPRLQRLAGRGELNAGAGAREQAGLQSVLELEDGGGNGRLGEA